MFALVVQLYRALQKPQVSQANTYSFEGRLAPEIQQLVQNYEDLPPAFGAITVREEHEHYSIEVELPVGDVGKFYKSVGDFVQGAPTLYRGEVPNEYYVIDIDYHAGADEPPDSIKEVWKIAEFIKHLSNFAEDSAGFNDAGKRLIFVLPPDGKTPQKTIVMPIELEEAALKNTLSHLRLLQGLTEEKHDSKLHIEERRLMMRSAIADVLSARSDDVKLLTHLVQHWSEVLKKYRHNFQAYINIFAFDAVRKKIADAEIEYASKLSGVLGDIAGKLLALPVSLAALVVLVEVKTDYAFWLGCISLFVITSIFWLVLDNQKIQVDRLADSFELSFSPFFSKLNTYPAALRKLIETRQTGFASQLEKLKFTFNFFRLLAIVPTIGALGTIIWRYQQQIEDFLRHLC
ncbi:MAG: hypothetical protein V4448_16830 [Pseudomonadota bacterium]